MIVLQAAFMCPANKTVKNYSLADMDAKNHVGNIVGFASKNAKNDANVEKQSVQEAASKDVMNVQTNAPSLTQESFPGFIRSFAIACRTK